MPKCGAKPHPAFQRAAYLRWQQCMSGIEVESTFGERRAKKKKPPKNAMNT